MAHASLVGEIGDGVRVAAFHAADDPQVHAFALQNAHGSA
jgi:hypothetical protein